MDLNFTDFFGVQIATISRQIKPLINYSPEEFNLDVKDLSVKSRKNLIDKKSKDIAIKMVKVEAFFALVSEINLDLNKNLNFDENNEEQNNNSNINNEKKIVLCETVDDLSNMFYSSRPRYWYHLSHDGKVLEQRMRIWFEDWGYKIQLSLDLIEYFTILNKLLKINAKSKIGLCEEGLSLVVDSLKIRSEIDEIKVESILDVKVFSTEGIYTLCRSSFSQDKEVLDLNEESDDTRYTLYKVLSLKNESVVHTEDAEEYSEGRIIVPGKKEIEKLVNGDLNAKIVVKTTVGEFYIKNKLNTLKPMFKELLEGLNPLVVNEKNKTVIKISIDELCQSARELEIDIPEDMKFREKNIKNIDFIELKYKKISNELIFDGFVNFVGMVNTGKTNLMIVLAYALAKRGLKTCLVLRDNQDVFEQLENINKTKNVKAVALVGANSKPEHIKKILSSNSSKIEKLKYLKNEENILDRINDERLEYGTYSCPLKAFFDNKNDSKNSIYASDNLRDKILCNNISLRIKATSEENYDKYIDKKIVCPFVKKCDSLKSNEYIPEGDVYITNIASFISTKTSKLHFKNPQRVSEFINKTCDLVLMDESDAVQLKYDDSSTSCSPIYNNKNKPSILEQLKDYEEEIRGNVEHFREHTKLLNRLYKTKITAFEILDKFTQNKIPGYLKKGTIVSKRVFNTLAFILSRNPEVLESHVKWMEGVRIENINHDETEQEKEYLRKLNTLFKHINDIIYRDSSDGLTICEHSYRVANPDEYNKYRLWFSYIDSIGDIYNPGYSLEEIYKELIEEDKNNIVNPATKLYIKENARAKKIVIELISLALLLAKIEGDLNKITSATGYVRSTLYDITKKDVENIPASSNFIRDYKGLLSKCPLGLYFGLKYNKENKYLEMVSWQGIGRDLFYLYPELWNYKDNNAFGGVNLAVFSGTSFMPKSPLYHIQKDVDYLMKPNTGNIIDVKYNYHPIIKEDGSVVINSGKNKNNPDIARKIYIDIAKGLTERNKDGISKLRMYLDDYTVDGRKRILVSVGNYLDSLRLASYLYEFNRDTDIEIATLYKENIEGDYTFNLPKERRLSRDDIKNIKNTKFNVVVVPQSAIQRGINMLQDGIDKKYDDDDIELEEVKVMASFSGILKTNRDYQVPDENLYAVARVSHAINDKKKELLKKPITVNYSLKKEVNSLFRKADEVYRNYYSTKFFADLEEDERDMIIGDLMVEDIQFSGRTIRGNVGTYITLLDGAFFKNANEGKIDNETTSTIVAMKKMCDKLKENETKKFIIDSLYGPFLKGIDELIINVKEGKN